MTFLYVLSYFSLLLQICFLTLAVAAGLYYLAELVEEFTVIAKRVITTLTVFTCLVYLLFLLFGELDYTVIGFGLGAQVIHFIILRGFPFVKIMSVSFLSALSLWLVNHYLAFAHFKDNYHGLNEVLAYFTICLWLVPFALFVSLGANDNVLPSHISKEKIPLLRSDHDFVTNHLLSKKRKVGLLSAFNFLKERIFSRNKKSF